MRFLLACLLLSLLGLTACRPLDLSPADDPPAEPSPTPIRIDPTQTPLSAEALTPTDQETAAVTPWPTAALPDDPAQRELIDQARADLAQRLSVAPEALGFVAFEAVTWPDAGLGCPEPGLAYTQVQVDGYRITFGQGKRMFTYHGGAGRGPFLCESAAGTPAPPPGQAP